MDTLRILLQGTTPMLMSNPAGMGKAAAPGNRKVIPTREEEAEERAYKFPNGTLGFPAVGVRNSILGGAKGLRHGKLALGPVLSGAILPTDNRFPFIDEDGNFVKDYIIDTQRVVIGKAGIMRSRPMLEKGWLLTCTFNYNREVGVNPEVVELATKNAGLIVGIGDYRIAKTGPYGGFAVRELEVLDSEGEVTYYTSADSERLLASAGVS